MTDYSLAVHPAYTVVKNAVQWTFTVYVLQLVDGRPHTCLQKA